MKVAAIDLGKTGCLCLLDTKENTLELHDVELDYAERLDASWLFNTLLDWEAEQLIIEDVFRRKSLIYQAGAAVAVSQLLNIPVTIIAVVTWKKAILGENTNNKEVSIKKCLELYPQSETLLKKPRARTYSPDRAESVLLAHYLKQSLSKK
jgi:hypothetical protein